MLPSSSVIEAGLPAIVQRPEANFEAAPLQSRLRKKTSFVTAAVNSVGPAVVRIDTERMVGMLAHTAMHDVMKIQALLPTVQPAHAPYCGFGAGAVINDHDVALGYVLEHFSSALPSYGMLSSELQRTIRFCTIKIAFNHGWFVQAEAPPGPLFSKFKAAILKNPEHSVSDIAFYFVHWLTDLAGAEPTPLNGSEKLVLRFPHPVRTLPAARAAP